MEKKWYIVHTYSGYENKVKTSLEERIKNSGKEELFGDILVPAEKVVEVIKGEKKTTSRKFFPGYILVKVLLNEETWHIVRNTPKITGFIGEGKKPVPITDKEVEEIVTHMREGNLKPRAKVNFSKGDNIQIIDGPFSSFVGIVEEVKPEKGRIKALVSIFGRPTPVELEFLQIKKT
jgi:transcriptional antiterminator NusG